MDLTTAEATLKTELASIISVLDLVVKYGPYLETLIPGLSEYLPLATKLEAALKAAEAALASA
jgi:hypothetical protein